MNKVIVVSSTIVILYLVLPLAGFCQQPVAYWPFNNSAADQSGNHNDGVIHGNVTNATDRFGNPCGAYHFDGTSAYIEVPTSATLEAVSTAFTITVWYKFDQAREYQWLTAICKGSGNTEMTDNPQYRLQVQQNSYFGINTCSPTAPAVSSTISINTDFTECDANFQNHPFEINKWSFYTLVYDGQKVVTYMNGSRVFDFPFTGTLIKNNSPLYIGFDQPGNAEYFEGSLDDIHIFNQALNDQQVLDLYNEKNKSNSTAEEFEMTTPDNVLATLPPDDSTRIVNFNAPQLVHSGCGQVTLRQIEGPVSGSNFRPGRNRITYEAVSSSGYDERTSFYVIVKDITPPLLHVPADTTIYIKKGETGIKYVYDRPTATDNYRVRSVSPVSGNPNNDFFTTGKHVIKYRATDVYENSSEKDFVIEIKEENPPPPPPPPHVDSLPQPQPPSDIDHNRPKEVQLSIEVENDTLKARLFDNAVYDHDTVTILLNGNTIIKNHEVSYKEVKFNVVIDTTRENEIVMYALNLGQIPPNTAKLVINDGPHQYEISLHSTLAMSGAIRIKKKKKP